MSDTMYLEFTDELQRRLATGGMKLNPNERAMLWRAQMGVWLTYIPVVPQDVQPLIYTAVDLIGRAAFLVEHGLERSDSFEAITTQLQGISKQIAEWA